MLWIGRGELLRAILAPERHLCDGIGDVSPDMDSQLKF